MKWKANGVILSELFAAAFIVPILDFPSASHDYPDKKGIFVFHFIDVIALKSLVELIKH